MLRGRRAKVVVLVLYSGTAFFTEAFFNIDEIGLIVVVSDIRELSSPSPSQFHRPPARLLAVDEMSLFFWAPACFSCWNAGRAGVATRLSFACVCLPELRFLLLVIRFSLTSGTCSCKSDGRASEGAGEQVCSFVRLPQEVTLSRTECLRGAALHPLLFAFRLLLLKRLIRELVVSSSKSVHLLVDVRIQYCAALTLRCLRPTFCTKLCTRTRDGIVHAFGKRHDDRTGVCSHEKLGSTMRDSELSFSLRRSSSGLFEERCWTF